jgi:hypothetical protein
MDRGGLDVLESVELSIDPRVELATVARIVDIVTTRRCGGVSAEARCGQETAIDFVVRDGTGHESRVRTVQRAPTIPSSSTCMLPMVWLHQLGAEVMTEQVAPDGPVVSSARVRRAFDTRPVPHEFFDPSRVRGWATQVPDRCPFVWLVASEQLPWADVVPTLADLEAVGFVVVFDP